jgi:hypothetical protein
VNPDRKTLLVRADFVLGRHQAADRPAYRRWRRILIEALPRLLGCADRCPRAERVRLHKGEGEGRFSGWLRIPVERRPGRKRVRKFKAKLRGRLEAGLLPIDGAVVKFGVRRCRGRGRPTPPTPATPVSVPVSVSPCPEPELVAS